MSERVGVAMVGAGAFGQFCLKAFSAIEAIRIVAIVDTNLERAQQLANQYGTIAYADMQSMLANPDVAIATLSTPPYLHAEQGLAALNAGKHVFCEKPLALTVEDGERMIQAAQAHRVQLTVNYVMRYNPFWQATADIAHSGVLGDLRHMELANHAAGLSLANNHWFWDKNLSGGIWIEHGVHFFDAFSWVSGAHGEVVSSQEYCRADGAVDRVEALLHYGKTAAHCYHGFDQSAQTEQTTVRLTFAKGYITLREWIPTSLELLTIVEAGQWEQYLPGQVTSTRLATGQIHAVSRTTDDKTTIYSNSIQQGLRKFAAAIRDPDKQGMTFAAYGLNSLKTAVQAEQMGD